MLKNIVDSPPPDSDKKMTDPLKPVKKIITLPSYTYDLYKYKKN